nr:beta-N-acetylhexosaminidase [Paenibacillus caui]
MDLRQKIGQMLLCGFEGTEITEEMSRLIEEYPIGGVIYFARNVHSVRQIGKLSSDLQSAAKAAGQLPLWISIDQEGGMVARITEGIALMPGAMAVAAAGSVQDAYESAWISGRELRALGINLNFAPVLDVNNNPQNPVIGVRSYGESPKQAADFGSAVIRGLQNAGVAATAKHFPGHGDTDVDSHLDLPTISHDRERMEQIELVPFKRAIEEGVDAIMSAHIYFPALEQEKLPVTLSRSVLTGLLREELGYEGIITTDCMEMNAIAEHYGTVEAAVMAVEAGADMVLISHRRDRQQGAFEALEQAVREGRISEERIDASVRRLLHYKENRGLFAGGPAETEQALREVGSESHRKVAQRISERSITLVKDEGGVLPLRLAPTLAITIAAEVATLVDETLKPDGVRSLGASLAALGLEAVDYAVPASQVSACAEELLQKAAAPEVEQIVIATYNARFSPEQIALVQGLHKLNKPLAVVSLRSPYDLLSFPEIGTYIAAYESRPLALESTAKALLGKIPFTGSLPVSLGEAYPAGWMWNKP